MHKRIILLFFITFIFLNILIFIPLYINDPLQIFHKDFNHKKTLLKNMRYQVAGLINNFKYDSIIFGSSMLVNTSSKEANKYLGGNFINISILGADFYERSLILKYTLEKKQIKTLLYSIDSVYIDLLKAQSNHYDYLYDNNKLNDFKAYINKKYLFDCFLGFSHKQKCIGYYKNIDMPSSWNEDIIYKRHFNGLNNWVKYKNDLASINMAKQVSFVANKIKHHEVKAIKNIRNKIKNSKKYVDKYLLSIIKQYPKTKFILIFPPYSRLAYAQLAQYELNGYEIYKYMLKYLANISTQEKNIEVYDFSDENFIDNINNYKDPNHYKADINSWMLKAIKNKNGLINSSNIDKHLLKIDKKNKEYNFIKIGQEIDNYLKANN